MQRCQYCGQLNDDLTDACIYCGEPLYIQVNHDDDYTNDNDHRYAIQVAQELLDEEENDKKRRSRKPQSFDDLDDFAKELLSPEGDNQQFDESIFNSNTLYDEDTVLEEDEIVPDKVPDETPEPTIKDDETEIIQEDNLFDDIEPYDQENVQIIEDDLKKKIKRNKKLEIRIGLSIKDIDLKVDQITKKLRLTGHISINHPLNTHENMKISLIFFDDNNQQLNSACTVLSMDTIKHYYDFSIESAINLNSVATIIILPEPTYDLSTSTPEDTQEPTPTNKPINKPKKQASNNKVTVNKSTRKTPKLKKPIQKEKTSKLIDKEKIDNQSISKTNSIFIENMKDIERKIGLDITNTSILTKGENSIAIVGEIYIKSPDKYNSINIAATCYDSDNNIIATETSHINTKLYLGFDTLNIQINDVDIDKINRIRLYPTFQ
ncbi:MAG: hypothetical protein LUG89_03105 [Methanosphaera sp.]|nr:hypothetical protein [Methanosphaera sp.]